jgi:Kiwa protein KwaB-like
MANLFALCRPNDALQVKRVSVTQPVQDKIEGVFQQQATAFVDGITEEIEFGSDWKPDPDEMMVMDAPAETAAIIQALDGNPLAWPVLNAANFIGEGIKALFIAVGSGAAKRVLMQLFTAQQILARRFSLLLDGETFKELTAPAFTFDNNLVAIIEDGKLKFKSFHLVKRIFQLNQFYQEASDQQIDGFCSHGSLNVENVEGFKAVADQGIRKLVFAISKTAILDQFVVTDIATKANSLGLNVQVEDGKIIMPSDRKSIKQLLRFLDDGIYEASLTSKRYITNSKRPFA